jgi:hypothetical protein
MFRASRILLLLAVVFVLAIVGCDSSVNLGDEISIVDNDHLDPEEICIDCGDGSATFVYTYNVDQPYLKIQTDETFTAYFASEDMEESIVGGGGEGIQVVQIAGAKAGETCWVTIHHTIEYDIHGVYQPKSCSFLINLIGKLKSSEIISDECGVDFVIPDPVVFFWPPPPGPYTFTTKLEPIVLSMDPNVKATFTLDDVAVPFSPGCNW